MALKNIREKGANGEREVVALLEPVVREAIVSLGGQVADKPILQRNQNQSAVGGSDLVNTFGLAIEVKRQEQLSINTWWQQCVTSAARNGEIPVLMFRQNQKKWRIMMYVDVRLPYVQEPSGLPMAVEHRAELDLESFLRWFRMYVLNKLYLGYRP